MKRFANCSLGLRLGIGQGVLVLLVMSLFTMVITTVVSRRAIQEAEQNLERQAQTLVYSMEAYHAALSEHATSLANVFRDGFPGALRLDTRRSAEMGGQRVPVLLSGSRVVNIDTAVVDRFSSVTHAVASVLVRSGDDFVRISTSLKKQDGSRACGTTLERNHPAYRNLIGGGEYIGRATLFGKDYMTKYTPVFDEHGRVIAVLFIGIDFTDSLKALKNRIRGLRVGRTGYVYALEAKPGGDQGRLTIHPTKEGENIIAAKDSNGRDFIREIIARKTGVVRYSWANRELGETFAREKVVIFRHFPEWDWIIAVSSYLDEFEGLARLVRNTVIISTVLVVALLFLLLTTMARQWVSTPIRLLVQRTESYASGDFSSVDVSGLPPEQGTDELGLLSRGMNAMALSLRDMLTRTSATSREMSVLNETLEQRVEVRTLELSETNKRLEKESGERQAAQLDLADKQRQLVEINRSLAESISLAVAEIRQKDQVLITQGRQVAMGELIGNIAHQWRQPLNALGLLLANINDAYRFQSLDADYLAETVAEGNRLVQKMSATINNFRNFFQPDKERRVFSAQKQIDEAIALVRSGFGNDNIQICLHAAEDLELFGFPKEYSQVLLNLLSNAKEAIMASGKASGLIEVTLDACDGQGRVTVSDNGGGIRVDCLDRIFEPYFSTKEMGTGIGLYMSKMIIERNMNGVITACNLAHGAQFTILTALAKERP